MATPRYLFISYASVDAPFVKRLGEFVVSQSYEAWIDTEKHHVGDWHEPVKAAIRDSIAVILVVTADSHKSANVKWEWEYALEQAVTLIRVMLIEIEVDESIRGFRKVDFTDLNHSNWDTLSSMLSGLNDEFGIRINAPPLASEKVKRIVADFTSPYVDQRIEAAKTLAEPKTDLTILSPIFWQVLIKLDSHDNQRVRREILEAMRNNPDSIFLPHLLRALKDESGTIRHIAAEVLGDIGDMSSESELIVSLQDPDPTVRFAAARSLGQISSTKALPYLESLLDDAHDSVRSLALEAIRKIRNSQT